MRFHQPNLKFNALKVHYLLYRKMDIFDLAKYKIVLKDINDVLYRIFVFFW